MSSHRRRRGSVVVGNHVTFTTPYALGRYSAVVYGLPLHREQYHHRPDPDKAREGENGFLFSLSSLSLWSKVYSLFSP